MLMIISKPASGRLNIGSVAATTTRDARETPAFLHQSKQLENALAQDEIAGGDQNGPERCQPEIEAADEAGIGAQYADALDGNRSGDCGEYFVDFILWMTVEASGWHGISRQMVRRYFMLARQGTIARGSA